MQNLSIFKKIEQYPHKIKVLLLALFILLIDPINLNHAMVTNSFFFTPQSSFSTNAFEKEVPYIFKVSDKLIGNGAMKVTIDKNTIKGIALGKGRTSQCYIDFHSNFEGTVTSPKGDINIVLSGKGTPLKIPFVSKIQFFGPLEGVYKHKKLKLLGKVNIKGRLAKLAGFRKKEELLIEVTKELEPLAFKNNS